MVGQKIGGVNVFGGGLALYKSNGVKVGAVGVSGDHSCTDHFVAWHVRNNLGLDHLAGIGLGARAPTPHHPDNIIFDITDNPNGGTGKSASGFGHPMCVNQPANPTSLPAVQK